LHGGQPDELVQTKPSEMRIIVFRVELLDETRKYLTYIE